MSEGGWDMGLEGGRQIRSENVYLWVLGIDIVIRDMWADEVTQREVVEWEKEGAQAWAQDPTESGRQEEDLPKKMLKKCPER